MYYFIQTTSKGAKHYFLEFERHRSYASRPVTASIHSINNNSAYALYLFVCLKRTLYVALYPSLHYSLNPHMSLPIPHLIYICLLGDLSMVRQPICPTTHWSENSLVRRPIGPKTHCSEKVSLVRKSVSLFRK